MKYKAEQLFIISTRMESIFLQRICMEWNCFIYFIYIIAIIIIIIIIIILFCFSMHEVNKYANKK
jgi:hypothetical protein